MSESTNVAAEGGAPRAPVAFGQARPVSPRPSAATLQIVCRGLWWDIVGSDGLTILPIYPSYERALAALEADR